MCSNREAGTSITMTRRRDTTAAGQTEISSHPQGTAIYATDVVFLAYDMGAMISYARHRPVFAAQKSDRYIQVSWGCISMVQVYCRSYHEAKPGQ